MSIENNSEAVENKIKFLAYYLPQFHPIPENDLWWGKGFTEWTNVAKAKPLFKDHYQPKIPADLGFYDLRLNEVKEKQAELAKEYGIDGFIYYQYHFGRGKMLLEKPAEDMLKDKRINIPFCFCWANETWKGIWHGVDNPDTLIEQEYGGEMDYMDYFNYLLPFFNDPRYIKVENKPMFHILRVEDIPDFDKFAKIFNSLAKEAGFDGVFLISTITLNNDLVLENNSLQGQVGLETFRRMRYSQNTFFSPNSFLLKIELKIKKFIGYFSKIGDRKRPLIFDYKKGVSSLNIHFTNKKYIACVFPNWDNSPRSGKKSLIFKNANPVDWEEHLSKTVNELQKNPENPPFIFIKSWNEWAEGNYLEPDIKFGHGWLQAVKNVKNKLKK